MVRAGFFGSSVTCTEVVSAAAETLLVCENVIRHAHSSAIVADNFRNIVNRF
jgi:hypothetical protein